MTTPHWNKPLAATGLISYRYKARYGFIMIGALNDEQALKEAQRSTHDEVTIEKLERWNGNSYQHIKGH